MKRLIFTSVIVLILVMMACSHAANLTPELQQPADTWPRCSSGCTANDASITYIWLEVDPGCTPGTPTSAQLWATYEVNRANGICCVVTVIDIYVGGNLTEDDYIIPTGNFTSSGTYNVSVANITWICGSVLTLEDIYAQWIDKGGQPCPTCTADCNSYKQPKCYKDAGPYEVHAPLVADFDFNEVCFCNNTTFTDTTTSGVKPYYSWDWDFGDGTAHSSAQNATHHYGSAGTYNVTLTVTDSDSPPNSDSQSYNVTVYTNPTVEITPDGGELTCATTFIILTADTTGSACTVTGYQWYKDDVALSGETGTTLNVTSPGDYKVEVECANGCTDDDEVTVTETTDYPTVNIIPDGGELTCTTTFIILTADTTGSGCSVTGYQWYKDDVALSGETGTTLNVTSPGDYKVEVECANGCTDDDEVTVTESTDYPTVNITPDGGELTCATTFIILTADTTGGGCSVTGYQWYKDDVALSGETGTTLNVISPGDYKVEVECANGCTDDDEVTVTQNTTPPKATASSNSPVSEGATIQLYGGPNGMTSYSWVGPGGWTSSLRNPIRTGATTAMAGTYTLTVTNSNGCTDDESTSVTVNAKPTATASSNSPVCEGGTIELYGGPGGMTSYSWTGPNGYSSDEQSPTVSTNATLAMAGNYALTVTDSNGCTATNLTTVTVNTKPTVDAGPDQEVCEDGDPITLSGATPSGGTWSGTGVSGNTFDPSGLTLADYTVTYSYTDTGTGCSNSDTKIVTVTECCCICGFVYRYGTMEALAGWKVILEKKTNPWVEVQSTITDANGKYCFCGLEDGEYRVSEVVKPNWIQVSPLPNQHLVTLPLGCCDPVSGPFLNFENQQGPAGSLTVGWEASPIDKLAVVAPWITLFAAIIAGVSLLVLRRRRV
jgi:PKD repeat protein